MDSEDEADFHTGCRTSLTTPARTINLLQTLTNLDSDLHRSCMASLVFGRLLLRSLGMIGFRDVTDTTV